MGPHRVVLDPQLYAGLWVAHLHPAHEAEAEREEGRLENFLKDWKARPHRDTGCQLVARASFPLWMEPGDPCS